MKSLLRERLLSQRLLMKPSEVIDASLSILYQLVKHPLFIKATHIGLFHPIKNEPDVTSLLSFSDKRFYLPIVANQSLIYGHFNQNTPLIKSPLNILEPHPSFDCSDHLELVIIPAIAIDQSFYRLGFGKGYFDRFLASHPQLKVIAIIYPFQMIEQFPHEDHDQPVDAVILSR